jgi:hypothetical protein
MKLDKEVIQRFLSDDGKVIKMPSKYQKKLNVIFYIGSKFKPGDTYNEQELNDFIKELILFEDFVTIRRYLVDYKFLSRDSLGKEYEVNAFEID